MSGLDLSEFPFEIISVTVRQWSRHDFLHHRNEVMERTHVSEWRGIRGAWTATGGGQQESILNRAERQASIMKFTGQTPVLTTHAPQSSRRVAVKFKKLINVRFDA
jgi:hypothetical protein